MLLKDPDQDSLFKEGFVRYVSPEVIRIDNLREYISNFEDFTKYGRAFRYFGKKNDDKAIELASIDLQCTGESDSCLSSLSERINRFK